MLSPKHPSGMTGAGIILTLMLPVTDVAANNRADVTLSATVVPVCELWVDKAVQDLGTIPADQFSGRAEYSPFLSTNWTNHQNLLHASCHGTDKYTITASSPNQPSFNGKNLLSDHPGNKMAFLIFGLGWAFNDPDSLTFAASTSAPDAVTQHYFYVLPTGSPGGVIPSPGQHTISLTLTIEPA
ncbi:hypothetical protein ACRZU2_004287 [Klebsiella variicola]